jgi:hypothetical protein
MDELACSISGLWFIKNFLVMAVKEIIRKINYCRFEVDFINLLILRGLSQSLSSTWRELSINCITGLLIFSCMKSKLGEARHVLNRMEISRLKVIQSVSVS